MNILDKYFPHGAVNSGVARKAVDETCISLLKWIRENGWQMVYELWSSPSTRSPILTDEQLYNKFISEPTNKS